jgi:uncharacterized membrane protein YozB (DUF420 family)
MVVLLIVTAIQAIHLARNHNLVSAFAKMPERDAMLLVIGAALIVGIFFAGQSDNYRGVHLIFVVAGFVAMRRGTENPATRAMLTWAIMIVVFLMWAGFFGQTLYSKQPGLGFGAYSLIREVLWWRLAALLLAVLAIFGAKSELFSALQQWRSMSSQPRPFFDRRNVGS